MSTELGTKFELVCDIIDRNKRDPNNLIAILQEIQEAYSYLPEDVMTYVATALEITPGTVFGVATFYSHFALEPKGKYVIKVCDGTACHVKKSEEIIRVIESLLGLGGDKTTTDDLLFTLEVVACVGACGIAPVVLVNEDVYSTMDVEKMEALIDELREGEAANA